VLGQPFRKATRLGLSSTVVSTLGPFGRRGSSAAETGGDDPADGLEDGLSLLGLSTSLTPVHDILPPQRMAIGRAYRWAGMTDLLDRLPRPSGRRVAVRVTEDARRQVRGGHPWVFESSITSTSDGARSGDLAVVFDSRRRFQAIGLYDPDSPIRVRVLHHGRPAPIDDGWWRERLAEVLARRSELAASADTTAYRCVHGENDGLPGLVADRYGDVLVVKLYSAAWIPHLRTVVDTLGELVATDAVVLRLSRAVQGRPSGGLADGMVLTGHLDGPVLYRENGFLLEADVVSGQKTGTFLDQRENRALVGSLAAGARVLDVFACTGGFSVAAAAGGARSVHSVDRSATALAAAHRNMGRNRHLAAVAACRHRSTGGDAFEVMAGLGERGERFDVVVVDPPSFAQNQASVGAAIGAYARLTDLAVRLVADGGLLVQASCSSRVGAEDFAALVHRTAAASGHRLDELHRTGHPVDHPVGFAQGAYLKALYARVRRS
jgi:23S rRNA (cytosine1962-C5)-methyltransferase